ncbi:hypothetical protein ACN4EG_19995 [Alkalinema pantanalense CENA528]|uniref:hypothetical protein n=1 Tax=Alkalinema pantanalense TaxID=1620705 RepID=UPI003D6F0F46
MLETCELCGAPLESRVEASIQGLFCTQCDWAVVTTYLPQIYQDLTQYKMYLYCASSPDVEQLKAISTVANINLIQARKTFQEDRPLILEGEAPQISEARKNFDSLSIPYTIEPLFPY